MNVKETFPCQQCGGLAAVVPGREYMQCEYCRSLVFTSNNPLTVDRITPMGAELDAACPTCQKTLCTGTIEDRPVLYCGACYGFLLKNEDFGSVVRLRRSRRERMEAEPVSPLNTEEYKRRLQCPNCDSHMEVHPYYGPGNIIIDSCQRCQYVWLDHGELSKVVRAEGGREPEPLPLHVNSRGDVTIIPEPEPSANGHYREGSPLAILADTLFGLW